MPLRIFIVTGTPYAAAASTAASRIAASSLRLYGSAPPPPLRVTFGDRAAEVEVDVVGEVLVDDDPHRLADDVRVDAVELEAARSLVVVEADHPQRLSRRARPGRAR